LLGAAIWLFSEGDMLKAGAFVVFSLFVMVIDNVLKPLVFGRKGGAPLLVVFIGALGGFMANGVIGLFTGAVVLAVGWELLRAWVMKGGGDREGTGSTASSDGASSDGALPDGALSDGTVAASSGAESGA
jgi:predicted PurR-regulated permease PerM